MTLTMSSGNVSSRPLPLKQRTSSVDARKDFTSQTWLSLLGLLKAREYFVTVDHFSIWRRHLAWAMANGSDLRGYMTQRYSSSMVFLSLLLSTELGVLFNSAGVTTMMRHQLAAANHMSIAFWAGMAIIVSALLTLLSLISTFTAWAMVSAIDEANAHCILRSSIGQYVAELPGRFIVCSIYSFLAWLVMFFFLLLPVGFWSMLLVFSAIALFVHVISAFSAFGRLIMHTGAMGSQPIFEPKYEASLLPHSLHANLLKKAQASLANKTSITRQYRRKIKPIDRHFSVEELSVHLSEKGDTSFQSSMPARKRTDSAVRFADNIATFFRSSPTAVDKPFGPHTTTPMSELTTPDSDRSSVSGDWSSDNQDSDPPKPPPLPKRELSDVSNLSNVSTPDLEKWLQSSQPEEQGSPSTNEPIEITAPAVSLPQFGDTGHKETVDIESGKGLTEDEQFLHDYGELFDVKSSYAPKMENGYLHNHSAGMMPYNGATAHPKVGAERSHLLDSGDTRRNNYSTVDSSWSKDSIVTKPLLNKGSGSLSEW